MIEVFVVFTGQTQRTFIPGGPFPDKRAAHKALFDFGLSQAVSYKDFVDKIDQYGYIIKGQGAIIVDVT